MTVETPKQKNDSSDETVIGFKGSEQHHDLKNQAGENGDASHADGEDAKEGAMKDTVKKSGADNAVSEALKNAVDKS